MCVSELGLLMKSCIDQGQLVPDDVISRLILNDLRALEQSSWLLDGESAFTFTFHYKGVSLGGWMQTCLVGLYKNLREKWLYYVINSLVI